MATIAIPSQAPLDDHPLDPCREPVALEVWILEIFFRSERKHGFSADRETVLNLLHKRGLRFLIATLESLF